MISVTKFNHHIPVLFRYDQWVILICPCITNSPMFSSRIFIVKWWNNSWFHGPYCKELQPGSIICICHPVNRRILKFTHLLSLAFGLTIDIDLNVKLRLIQENVTCLQDPPGSNVLSIDYFLKTYNIPEVVYPVRRSRCCMEYIGGQDWIVLDHCLSLALSVSGPLLPLCRCSSLKRRKKCLDINTDQDTEIYKSKFNFFSWVIDHF